MALPASPTMTTSEASMSASSSTEPTPSQLLLLGNNLLHPLLGKLDNVRGSGNLQWFLISKFLGILYDNNLGPRFLLQCLNNLPTLAYDPGYKAPWNHHLVTCGTSTIYTHASHASTTNHPLVLITLIVDNGLDHVPGDGDGFCGAKARPTGCAHSQA